MSKIRKGLSREAKQKRIEYHIDQRLEYYPENIFYVEGFDWRYVPVHPLADEAWWFEKFKQSPEICLSADFYWQFDGDVAFLEISTAKYRDIIAGKGQNMTNEEFLARWNGSRTDGLLNLHAWVLDDLIYSQTVKRVMNKFWNVHQTSNLFETFYLKKQLIKLENL
jgi:hypothetical protein